MQVVAWAIAVLDESSPADAPYYHFLVSDFTITPAGEIRVPYTHMDNYDRIGKYMTENAARSVLGMIRAHGGDMSLLKMCVMQIQRTEIMRTEIIRGH